MSRSEKVKMVACYIRVSTLDLQDKGLGSQMHALKQYCDNHGWKPTWYRDKLSGASTERPAFDKLQKDVFQGKVKAIVVWKLDRISRKGIKDGINILTDWLEKDIRFISVTQQFDFSGQVGKLVASVLFAVAAMEREGLIENVKRGMAAARAKGIRLGRPPKLSKEQVVPLLEQGQTILQVAEQFDVTIQAVYSLLYREGIDLEDLRKGK